MLLNNAGTRRTNLIHAYFDRFKYYFAPVVLVTIVCPFAALAFAATIAAHDPVTGVFFGSTYDPMDDQLEAIQLASVIDDITECVHQRCYRRRL